MTATQGPATMGLQAIPRRADQAVAPMSHAQELLWLIDRASPGHTAYNVPRALRLSGQLDESALRRALDGLVARHAVLRTTYETRADRPVQVVHPAAPVELAMVDLRALSAPERATALQRELRERAAHQFDLGRETQFRAALLRLGEAEHVLFLLSHHICSDGWAKAVLFRDLGALYAAFHAGREPALTQLPIQYADYAAWERAHADGDEQRRQLAYWREQLHGPLPALELPTDRPRSAAPGAAAAGCTLVLSRAALDGLRRLGQAHDATLYMVLLAAYHTLLHRYTGQDDIVTGSPIANRNRSEVEGLLGLFANTLVMRSKLSDDPTFAELLRRVSDTCLDAFDHSELPLERLVLELQHQGAITQPSLFQAVLTMEDTVAAEPTLEGLTVTSEEVGLEQTKFDLTLLVREQGDGLRLALYYRTDLHDGETIGRMLGHLRVLLEGAVADPNRRLSALPLLTEPEHSALAEWNRSGVAFAPQGVVEQIAARAAQAPDRVAVVCGDQRLTYAELDRRATELALRLRALGVTSDAPVGLALDRSAELIVGLLGILRAGGAYVPLLPELPDERIARQMAESGLRHVVTTTAVAKRLPSGLSVVRIDADTGVDVESAGALAAPAASQLAYVLFTSGSTGTPKGVAVTHANLANYTRAASAALDIDLSGATPLAFGMVSTVGADLGNTSLFPALCSGGTLHLLPQTATTEPARFAEYVTTHPLDVLKITPSHLRALVGERPAPALLPRHALVLGGEALSWDLADQLVAAGCRVFNHYGPTETTVGCCTFPVGTRDVRAGWPRPASVPIGLPMGNMRLHVLDRRMQPVPVGVPGELYIGGAGVARGYLGRPELTAERFVADPFAESGALLYRTGDRVRRLASGDVEFLGRFDLQVKIRGYRVELGEIEAVLRDQPAVRDCAVLYREDAPNGAMLVAYVVADALSESALRSALAARLPDYMVPGTWVRIDVLPLNANGKIDRAALVAPTAAAQATARVAPRDAIEETLARIWAETLKRDVATLGVHDSFLDLGGHSLVAIRILGRVSREWGLRLPLRQLFEQPTIAQLAETIRAQVAPKPEAKLDDLMAALQNLPEADVLRLLSGDVVAGGDG